MPILERDPHKTTRMHYVIDYDQDGNEIECELYFNLTAEGLIVDCYCNGECIKTFGNTAAEFLDLLK